MHRVAADKSTLRVSKVDRQEEYVNLTTEDVPELEYKKKQTQNKPECEGIRKVH